ncbi:predicted protein [Histoplasma mississippiense (nom. inval.)]|uniref:predicted protein n=1 Tax=Ajellomyces capsulatus (strain NAm1 / WU24) TaxID=2059318 RepID=UPI000157C526|nr:predicted protein [Histoplasma mississippiense (nom. inval.)]EDN08249.1 predicted protein [Histoplasma mississippiense (nom. inval.)]
MSPRQRDGRRNSRSTDEEYVVFIQGIPPQCRWQELKDLVRQTALHIRQAVVYDDCHGHPTGLGQIIVKNEDEAWRTYNRLSTNGWNGNSLTVTLSLASAPTKPIAGPTKSQPPSRMPYAAGGYSSPPSCPPLISSPTRTMPPDNSNSFYNFRQDSVVNFSCSICIQNLAIDTTWQNLKDYLRTAGTVERCDIREDRKGGGRHPRAYATATFRTKEEARRAVTLFDNAYFKGSRIRVRIDRDNGGGSSGSGNGAVFTPYRLARNKNTNESGSRVEAGTGIGNGNANDVTAVTAPLSTDRKSPTGSISLSPGSTVGSQWVKGRAESWEI